MSLMDQIKRAQAAKTQGGLGGPDGLALAASLPSVEELADRFAARDPDLSEAEALAAGAERREELLGALEDLMTVEADPQTDGEGHG